MSLDYTTCAALRDAGYPQGESCIVWVLCEDESRACISGEIYDQDNGAPLELLCACPNSDELIAAIQQRWPDYGIAQTTNMSWPLNPPGPARIDGYDAWVIGRDALTWDDSIGQGQGDTPAAALAALYLALAGGE